MTGGNPHEPSITATARAVLAHLCEHSAFPTWVLTRTVGNENVVLAAVDPVFGLIPQQVLPADPTTSPRFSSASMAMAPVRLPDGSTFGSLIGLGPAPLTADPSELGPLIDLLAGTLGAVLGAELALTAERRISERATAPTDTMTGLLTRQAWEQRLRREEQRCGQFGESASVLLVYFDELKRHNELHGHQAGDEQLRDAAALFHEVIDNRHLAARTTGDQFAVLVIGASDYEIAQLEASLRQSLSSAGISAVLGVGVRRYGTGLDSAITEAEASLASAHTATQQVPQVVADSAANSQLLEALERGAIRAYFQPIVDLRSGEVVSIEALARWQTEDGVREPDQFLHLMQQEGLLGALFERILDDGLEHLVEFRHVAPNLQLAVNFEFDAAPDDGLVECVASMLRKHGLPGEVLSLELSERQTFDLSAPVKKELVDVAGLGVRLFLDDFGTGFASLETLTSLPISGVKLDRRFTGQVVSGDREPAVVKAMISMAAEAGLVVIAEGIETQTQCDRLVRLGCRLGQGYLFALPQPADSLSTVLSAPLVSTF